MLMLMFMIVSPVTTAILQDSVFEWSNTINPVISTIRQRIALEWIYKSKEPVSSMVFTRFKNSSDIKVHVGKWTQEEGFKPDPVISTELTLIIVPINGTNENKVSLILEDPVDIDYDLHYNCQVTFADPVQRDSFPIELRALRPYWTRCKDETYASLGEDVTFMWEYKYPFRTVAVFIGRENNSVKEQVEVGTWYQGVFIDLGELINRVVVTKTPNEDQTGEKIRLTLKNVSVEDFGWQYVCELILGDGEKLLSRTMLKDSVFKWSNTTNPVISTLHKRIALEWIYESEEPVSSMVFTRFRNSKDIKFPVGKWTKEEGFKPDPVISTELTLIIVPINGTNETKVSLILKNPIYRDFGHQYNCQVTFGDPVQRDNFPIELRVLRQYMTHTELKEYAAIGDKLISFKRELKDLYRTYSWTSTATRSKVGYSTIMLVIVACGLCHISQD